MTVGELKLLFLLDDKSGPQAKAIASKMKALGGKIKAVGKTMSAAITLPLVAIGAVAIKSFAEFDSAMTQSLAIMGDIDEAMRVRMTDAAKELGATLLISATDAAESFFFLASAGFSAEESLAALPKVALFAQAGMFDMALATDLATDATSALGLGVDDLTRVTDVLVKANTLANASVQQFAEALTNRTGPALRAVGKDIEEGTAVLAALADQGVKGAEAGTQLGIVMRNLQAAAIDNKRAFEQSRVAVFDASGEMRNMGEIIADLEGFLAGMSDEQKKASLAMLGFNDRAQATLLTLLGTSGSIREYEKSLRSAQGVTQEIANNQLKGFGAQLKLLKGSINVAAIELGEALAPAISTVASLLSDAATWFRTLSADTKTTIVVVAGLAAAIGPLLIVLGSIVALAPSIATAVTVMFGPWGVAVAAVVAVMVGLNTLLTQTQKEINALAGATATATAEIELMTRAQLALREVDLETLWDIQTQELLELAEAEKKATTFAHGLVKGQNVLGEAATALDLKEQELLRTEELLGKVRDRGAKITEDAQKAEENRKKELERVRRVLTGIGGAETELQKIIRTTAETLLKSAAAYTVVGDESAFLEQNVATLEGALANLIVEEQEGTAQWLKYKGELEETKGRMRELADEMAATDGVAARMETMQKAMEETSQAAEDLLGDFDDIEFPDRIEVSIRRAGQALEELKAISFRAKEELGSLVRDTMQKLSSNISGVGGLLQTFFSASGNFGVALGIGMGLLKTFGVDFEGFFNKVLGNIGKAIGGFVKELGGLLGIGGGGKSELQISIDAAFDDLSAGFDQIAAKSAVLGEEFDRAGAEISLLEGIMIDLLLSGVKPSEPAYQRLAAALAAARKEGILASEIFEQMAQGFAQGIVDLSGLDLSGLGGGFGDFGTIIGDIFASIDEHIAGLSGTFDEAAIRAGLLQRALDDYTAAGGTNSFVIEALTAAIARLGEASAETAAGFGTWVGSAEALVAILLNDTIPALEAEAAVAAALGLEYDLTAKKQAAYKDLIEKLAKTLGLNSPVVQDLIDQYHALGGATEFVVIAEEGLEDARRRGAEFTREYTEEEQRLIDLLEEELRIKGILAGIEDFLLDRTTRITAEFGQFADASAQASDMIRLLNEAMIRMREDGLEGTDMFNDLSRQLEAWQTRLADITDEAKRAAKEAGKIRKEQEEGAVGPDVIKVGDIKVKIKFPSRISVQLESLGDTVRHQLSQPLLDMVRLWTGSPTAAGLFPVLPGPSGGGEITINVLMDGRRIAQQVVRNIPGVINLRLGSGTS